MKKVVSLLLAVATVLGVSVGAFAAEDIAGNDNGTTLRDQYNELYADEDAVYGDNDVVAFGEGANAGTDNGNAGGVTTFSGTDEEEGIVFIGEEDDYDTPSLRSFAAGAAEGSIRVAAGELFLVMGKTGSKTVVPYEYVLEPGTEYTFNIFCATANYSATDLGPSITDAGVANQYAPLTAGMLGDAKLRLRNARGTSVISSAKIEKRGSGSTATYNLVITTRDSYSTKITDVSYMLSISGTQGTMPAGLTALAANSEVAFRVGYQTMDDDDVDEYEEGDVITVYRDTPVFTKKQLDRIAKSYNYKAVEFEAEDYAWYYTGRVSGMSDTNFIWTHDVIPSIMNQLDQDFKFLTFNAGVSFPTNGEMRIDVDDVSDDWSRIYTYLYRNGTLTPINTTYDYDSDQIVFRTNYLGAFVMTDTEITNLAILAPEENVTTSPAPGTTSGIGNVGNATENPNMGIPTGMNLVIGLGVLSLLGAGTVLIRKKK